MRIQDSGVSVDLPVPPTLFVEALEIAVAAAFGRYCALRVSRALRTQPSHRPAVAGTLKIVRFTIAYLAVLTVIWTLEFSTLYLGQQIAVIVLAAFVGGGAIDDRRPVIRAVCSGCGKQMTRLAETSRSVAFGCQTCGTTLSVPK